MTQETARFSEFADLIGRSPSFVTQLKQADRLVLTDDGKRVRVAESVARIGATEDPSKVGVKARHAAAREQGATQAATYGSDVATGAPVAQDSEPPVDPVAVKASSGYQQARAVRERYAAMHAKLDYERAIGKLLDVDHVTAAAANAATTLRARIEALPDELSPQLVMLRAEKDIHSLLAGAFEHALEELARQFTELTKAIA